MASYSVPDSRWWVSPEGGVICHGFHTSQDGVGLGQFRYEVVLQSVLDVCVPVCPVYACMCRIFRVILKGFSNQDFLTLAQV